MKWSEQTLRLKGYNPDGSRICAESGESLSSPASSGSASPSPALDAGQKPAEYSPNSLRSGAGIESNEREMHKALEGWCRVNELSYIHSRMDRKSTISEGWPDFTIIKGNRVCCVELKHGVGQLSDAQKAEITILVYRGTPTLVTNNVKEAIEWVKEKLLQ